jgi:hypothetical protein
MPDDLYDYDSCMLGPVEVTTSFRDQPPKFDSTERAVIAMLEAYVDMTTRLYSRDDVNIPSTPEELRKKSYYTSLYELCSKLSIHSISPEEYPQYVLEMWPTRNKNLDVDAISTRADKNRYIGIVCPSITTLTRESVQQEFFANRLLFKPGALFPTPGEALEEIICAGEFKMDSLCAILNLGRGEVLKDPLYLGELPVVYLQQLKEFYDHEEYLLDNFGFTCDRYIELRISGIK